MSELDLTLNDLPRRHVSELRWLSNEDRPVWCGLYGKGGVPNDPDIMRWIVMGLVEPVAGPFTSVVTRGKGVGRLTLPGGYQATSLLRSLVGSKERQP